MFPDGLESFQMAWKVSRWPGKFPDCLETFYILHKLSRFTKTFQVALLPCYLGFSASVFHTHTPAKRMHEIAHHHNHHHDHKHHHQVSYVSYIVGVGILSVIICS